MGGWDALWEYAERSRMPFRWQGLGSRSERTRGGTLTGSVFSFNGSSIWFHGFNDMLPSAITATKELHSALEAVHRLPAHAKAQRKVWQKASSTADSNNLRLREPMLLISLSLECTSLSRPLCTASNKSRPTRASFPRLPWLFGGTPCALNTLSCNYMPSFLRL